jgi:Icc protein
VPVRIAQITDLHLLPPGELLMGLDVNARLDSVLAHALAREPDAIFLTGDFCAIEPDQEMFHQLRARLDLLHIPYYLTPGNHDDREMLRNAFYLDGHNYEPIRGLIRVKGHNFLFLDSSPGMVDGDQVKWLSRALVTYPDATIVMHHPPVPLGVAFMDSRYPLRQPEELLAAWKNLEVHLCPPTSFFINPDNKTFEQEMLPPGYLMLEWPKEGGFRVIPYYVPQTL